MHNYVHLRLHTEYSITDSILRINDVISLAKQDKMLAITMTDLHNMFAVIKFYAACRTSGIKPIIGSEVNVSDGTNTYKVIILVKNIQGYQDLCNLITRSYLDNKINDIPYIHEEWLLNQTWLNLIVLSGGVYGDVGQLIIAHNIPQATSKAQMWQKAFPDSYYLELQRIQYDHINYIIQQTVLVADNLSIPLVATHPTLFAQPSNFEAHEVRVCIATGQLLYDENRQSSFTYDQYFHTQAEMLQLFDDIPQSIINTVEIAKRCNFEIPLGKYALPNFTTPNGMLLNDYFEMLASQGLESRIQQMQNQVTHTVNAQTYSARLESEIVTIIQMDFVGYFLIVADFINWAKQNQIPVGPGRGSGAGSLVAFALGITDVDPLQYNLLFERFLNEERVSLPDFDIDFCQLKRELVIDYVKQKYGSDSVAQIVTFGTMTSKAVLKDVGRVLGLPYGLCDSISKMIINTPAKAYTLNEAYLKFTDLKQKIDQADDVIERLWELSLLLEGLTRNVGKHAAGVLIAPSKITDFCPLYLADGMQTSQLDKDDVELVGLVKFDFLGLRNLTIIADTVKNIATLHKENISLSYYDFADVPTYTLLQQGNTAAVFQLESTGMKRILVKLKPENFEEIIALLALYRPGPLGSGMVDDFIKRKHGEQEALYFHDDLKECLLPTYGVIVYQEQVMQISQIIGGYTLGEADLLRRAMGKKKLEEMHQHKKIFIAGAIKNNYSAELAESLFDLMAKFAEYGFNKSHSAAYAMISYHTAYLKVHYLSCFMAATMSLEMDDVDKLYELYQDCRMNKLIILAPDINQSIYQFMPINHTSIRYALGALRGIGEHAALIIGQERTQNGPFVDFNDFIARTFKHNINRKTIESLIKSGAFDTLEPHRAKLLFNLDNALEQIQQQVDNSHQGSLFEGFGDNTNANLDGSYIQLNDCPIWTIKQKLTMEKQAFGYYFSGSLFEEYRDIVVKLNIPPLNNYALDNEDMQAVINNYAPAKKLVSGCGIIKYISAPRYLKNGKRMHFLNIEDDSHQIEIVVYETEYIKYKDLLREDEMIFIEGELIYDSYRNSIKISVIHVYNVTQILNKNISQISLSITSAFNIQNIHALLGESNIKLILSYSNMNAACNLSVAPPLGFILNDINILKINELLGPDKWNIT